MPEKLVPHEPLAEYYADESGRQPFLRSIFDASAPHYERMIQILSLGAGTRYRRDALLRHGVKEGMRILDVATGSGIVARLEIGITKSPKDVIALDPSIGMLVETKRSGVLRCVRASGERIPFRDEAFQFVSMGYALRHMPDLRTAFDEYYRVLAKEGRVLILEITPPRSRVGFGALKFYMNRVVPTVVGITTRSRDAKRAMKYYWDTTAACVPPQSIMEALRQAGFRSVERNVVLGVFSEYVAIK